MRRLTICMLLGMLALAVPASAANILVWVDFNQGTSAIPGALSLLGQTATTATSQSNFNTLLAGGGWDLVIFGEQNVTTFPGSSALLTSYVGGGGNLLATTWRTDSGLAPLMQAVGVGYNYLSVTNDSSVFFDGIVGDVGLINPGWGIWSRAWNPVGGATGFGPAGAGFGIILGNGGHTILSGPLFDTYLPLGTGERFVANQIDYLLGGQVPEPATCLLLGAGLGALALLRRRA